MISSGYFKRAVFISLLGHLTVFSIFSLSFGNRLAPVNYTDVYFWGGILRHYDFIAQEAHNKLKIKEAGLIQDKTNPERSLEAGYSFKPALKLAFSRDKIIFTAKIAQAPLRRQVREPVVMFHPVLPYHFTLYFKDRQKAHIELMFNIASGARRANSIIVRRKIASGNLEVDLLSMRYISHYLFLQQARFIPDKWQTVKIEFSPRGHD
ncbi:MAG: hypothetical protein WC321_05645 [Candidatus Omnitrophota bacterium]|jgi:hypothetical protein